LFNFSENSLTKYSEYYIIISTTKHYLTQNNSQERGDFLQTIVGQAVSMKILQMGGSPPNRVSKLKTILEIGGGSVKSDILNCNLHVRRRFHQNI
jgi:hypothetical protein